jgi:energy-coupling factor transporter ATP-binding protein EcfA2
MRVDLANCILQEKEIIVFDEFTSVVNREVAKTGSYAISKAVKKLNKKFIAVACHSDIIEWLEPDWIYNTDEQRFFFALKNTKDQLSNFKSSGLGIRIKNEFGIYSKSIII